MRYSVVYRRHIDQVRFRTDVRQEEPDSRKPEQPEWIVQTTALPTVKDTAKHTQDSIEPIIDSDVGKTENQVEEATKSNDESEARLEPPPIAFPGRCRRYRPPEGFVQRRSERIRERTKRVGVINQGRL